MGKNLRASRNRNRTPVQAMIKSTNPGGFGFPQFTQEAIDAAAAGGFNPIIVPSTGERLIPGTGGDGAGQESAGVLGKPGGFIGDAFDFITDIFVSGAEEAVGDFITQGGGGGGGGGSAGGRTATGRDAVFGSGGGRGQTSNISDDVAEILAELGLGPAAGSGTQRVSGEESQLGGTVSGLFTDLDANQLEDSVGRPLVVNPGIEQRIKCPRGYVAVEIDDAGTRVCMLKGAAVSQGLYSRRPRPPISASEWRILKSSGRTAKKVEVVLGKAGAAVGKKLISKSARPRTTTRARALAHAPTAQRLLNATNPSLSDDDTVIIT